MKPTNQQPYFPHESNSRNKDKIIRLRLVHGVAGYGVYFMLLERLRSSDDFFCELDYDVLSFDFVCEPDLIRSVITDFGLFEISEDGKRFFSIELAEYMAVMVEAKKKRTESAKNAANARWGNNTPSNGKEANDKVSQTAAAEKSLTPLEILDAELQDMKGDTEWCESIVKESGVSGYDLKNYLETFKLSCHCNGHRGHKDMNDAKSHFRSYLKKILNNAPAAHIHKSPVNMRLSKKETDRLKLSDKEREKKLRETAGHDLISQSADNYFRNRGYVPGECTFRQLGDPDWIKNNPPTHPEWIGHFPGRETVEEVNKILENKTS